MFLNTDESLASFLGVWEHGMRWRTSKIWSSQKSQTLGWIRGSYSCLADAIGAACVFSLQISVLAISPLHGFSRGVTGPGHSTAVCRLLQHGLGVHWCLSYWRPWTQVRCVAVPFNSLVIDVLPAYHLGQSYPLLSLHYYGWSMPV